MARTDETLWEFLHHRDDVLKNPDGETLVPLLIFDQFEEIFTLAQTDDMGRARAAAFVTELADLVENRPPRALDDKMEAEDGDEDDPIALRYDFDRSDYRILISLREDYLAPLEAFKAAMPSITQNRMRLARMTGAQALEAVMRPGGKLVTEEVAGAIVRFIAGGAELQNAEVEPSLLSLICRELNNTRIAQGKKEISPDLLAGSHATILSEFYARALADQPPGVHRFIEDQLLTEAGYRENLAEERVRKAFEAAGAEPGALMRLVDRRLLRIEDRLDLRRVELTHDVLCNVVKAARDLRKETEAREAAQRQLLVQQEKEQATRLALARSRRITAICVVLTVMAIGGALFGYVRMKDSQQTQALADTTRANAEKLVVFLLDDFYEKLLPIGQIQLLSDMAGQSLEYYRRLPQQSRTDQSDLNMSQALLSLSKVRSRQGKQAESESLVKEAMALLEPKFARPPVADELKWRMSNALIWRASMLSQAVKLKVSRDLRERALVLTESVAAMPNPPIVAREAYARARRDSGIFKMQEADFDGAKKDLSLASAILRGRTEFSVQSMYVNVSGWLYQAAVWTADFNGAERTRLEIIAAAGQILLRTPDNPVIFSTLSTVLVSQAFGYIAQHQPGQSQTVIAQLIQETQTRAKKNPDEKGYVDNLAIFHMITAHALFKAGTPQQTIEEVQQTLAPYRNAPADNFQSGNLYLATSVAAAVHAELEQPNLLGQDIEGMKRHISASNSEMEANSPVFAASIVQFEARVEALRASAGIASKNLAALKERANKILADAKPDDTLYRLTVSSLHDALCDIERIEANAAESRGDFVQAEAVSRSALEHRKLSVEVQFLNDRLVARTEHALALARLNRLPEASEEIQKILSEQRGFIAAGSDDQMLRLELARTLYVVALTKPATGTAELKEALALLDKLPAAMQPYRSVRMARDRITAEIGKRSGAKVAVTFTDVTGR